MYTNDQLTTRLNKILQVVQFSGPSTPSEQFEEYKRLAPRYIIEKFNVTEDLTERMEMAWKNAPLTRLQKKKFNEKKKIDEIDRFVAVYDLQGNQTNLIRFSDYVDVTGEFSNGVEGVEGMEKEDDKQ